MIEFKSMDTQKANPYITEDGKPRLRNSVAAFIDILSYADYIKASFKAGTGQQELIRLRDALDDAYSDLKQKASEQESPFDLNLKVRTFTDNLVIGYPIPGPINNEDRGFAQDRIQSVVFYIAFLQAKLAVQGYLIRGAITVGDLYVDDDIVFGPAIISAVEAERSIAVYPRVVLCDEAVKAFRPSCNGRKIHDLLIDSDSRVFIDYLDATVMIAYPDDRPFTEFLEGHKKCVVDNLRAFNSNPKIRSKYEWAATYHNSFCNGFPDLFNEDDKVPVEFLIQSPKPWIIPIEENRSPT